MVTFEKVSENFDFDIQLILSENEKLKSKINELSQLISRNQLLAHTVSNVSECVSITDMNNIIIYINEAFLKTYGYRASELIGKNINLVNVSTNQNSSESILEISKKNNWQGELINIKKDGTHFPIRLSTSLIYDDQNKPYAIVGIARDISLMHKMETALRESEEKFRMLAESLSVAVLIYQNDKFIYLNPAVEKITGFKKEELLLKNFWDIIHPDYQQLVKNRGQARQNGENVITNYQFIIITASKTEKWVELTGNTIFYKGKYAGLITVVDITKQKKYEEQLKTSLEKYEQTLKAIPDLLFRINENGIFTDFYASANDYLVIQPDKIIGSSIFDVHPKNEAEESLRILRKCIKENKPQKWEYFVDTENGRRFFETRFVKAGNNEVLALCRDITDKKITELKLESNANQVINLNKVLFELIKSDFSNFDETCEKITEIVAQVLNLERVSIWFYNENHSRINCIDLYSLSSATHSKRGIININEYEEYFNALQKDRSIIAFDALNDFRTKEFAESYLIPNHVFSMLDSHIWYKNEAIGIICFEYTETIHEWTPGEISFSVAIADIVSIALEKSERKKVELSLEQEHEQMLSLFENINESIYVSDLDTYTILYSNLFTKNIFQEEIVGKKCYQIFHGKDSPCEFCTNEKIINLNGKSYQWEFYNKHLNGYYFLTDKVIKWSDNKYVRFEVAVDITKLKEAQKNLIQYDENYRLMFENSNDAILILEPETYTILEANQKASLLYGIQVSEFIGSDISLISLKGENETDKINEVFLTGIFSESESEHINSEGDVIYIYATYSIIQKEEKKLILCTYRDISQIKFTEKTTKAAYQIAELIHNVHTLSDLLPDIHKIVGQQMPANNFYIALFNEEKGIIEFPYFVDEMDFEREPRKPSNGLIELILRTGKSLILSNEELHELIEKDEIEMYGTFPVDWLGVPLKTQDKTIGVLVIQSYTERVRYRKRELEIIEFVSRQIAMSIERIRVEDELKRARDKAEETNKVKSNLLRNLSHEFRSPMNIIVGYADLLMKKTENKEYKSKLDAIINSAERLTSTLNSILFLAELEGDNKKLEFKKVNVAEIIHEVFEKNHKNAILKNLIFTQNIESKTIEALGSVICIREIINNFVDNAIKFTNNGSVNISLNEKIVEQRKYIQINVTDTGIGIKKEDFKLIFQEFRQVSEGLTRNFGGCGLGLAVNQKMAELMNGSINVESEINKGSIFTLMLPAFIS